MPKNRLRVLVVDDDPHMVKTICDILRIKGHETVPAYSGEEAVNQAMTQPPDCVLMDIKLPGFDGLEALRRIKQVAPALPVALMSSFVTEGQITEAKRQGAYAVLTKPVDVQQVLAFLKVLKEELSILVVDDDPLFCRSLKDILQTREYRVETETDAGKVIEHLARGDLQVVLLDLNIGEVSGMDLLQEIQGKYPDKSVVLVTGDRNEMTDAIEQGQQVGAYTCLYKPLDIEQLFSVVDKIGREKLIELLEK